ncbi:hypothetical protein CcrC1_gp338 [Caulobacter phage C1]|nr:hypothetical protein CcrC1_gp338 [Caulobacter phage C1]UTU08567.1 hypothetical protein CcrC2_gp339 [Caulobacter phage C2]UTU09083.1 hypothetical protein CcrJ4_gp334 [Caulobacter phage J4]UTU10200.1 hypothetical protein CcrRB23_gp338 [Caulobacter phage RB23]WGN97234.1 hypothetical protein [Bertelyvirus sp.]
MSTFTYLGIPYTSKNPDPVAAEAERAARMVEFWKGCAFLIERGDNVVSPMTLEPALTVVPDIPYDWPFWQHYSRRMLATCTRLVVMTLPGWEVSSGIAGEIEEAERLGLEIEYLAPEAVDAWVAGRQA